MARLIRRSAGITDLRPSPDDELEGALLLSGHSAQITRGRFCFQTTYLNDRAREYLEHFDFRLIWVLREPRSVVYSMLFNWKRAALNRLYDDCGATHAIHSAARLRLSPNLRPAPVERACASYIAKTEQAIMLSNVLGERMLIVDYNDLVQHKRTLVPRIFEFAQLQYEPELLEYLHDRSLHRGPLLSASADRYVDARCSTVYACARSVLRLGPGSV
jgi:hypothetical protein